MSTLLTVITGIFANFATSVLPAALQDNPWRSWVLFAIFAAMSIGAGLRVFRLGQMQDAESKQVSDRLRRKYRKKMLKEARRILIEDDLERSLFSTAPIDTDVTISPRRNRTLSELFDDFHALLVTGGKGMGKTTLLLRVADHLLQKAESDEEEPVPALIPLVSWARTNPPLDQLMIDHLRTVYNIRPDVAADFVQNEEVVPLLDGLDELAVKQRSEFVHRLNAYSLNRTPRFALACNQDAYAKLPVKPEVKERVTIKPLTKATISSYLSRTSSAEEQRVISLDTELVALLTALASPLAIELTLRISQETSSSELRSLQLRPETGDLDRLVEKYARKVVQDPGPYSSQQAFRWLIWIARSMAAHGEYQIPYNRLQPNWLPSSLKSQAAWGVALAYGGLFGLVLGLMQALLFGLLPGLIIGLGSSIIVTLARHLSDEPGGLWGWLGLGTGQISSTRGRPRRLQLFLGVLLGLNVGVVAAVIGLIDALLFGLLVIVQPGLLGREEMYLSPIVTRVVLAYNGLGPWNYSRFLAYAVERGILRRTEDMYSFRHAAFFDFFSSPEAAT